MLFNSFRFVVFFPIVIMIYFIIPPKSRYIWLLLSSYFFYMCWNAKYALLLLGSTLITYAAGLLMNKWRDMRRAKQAVMVCSLTLNFGILFFFKYFDFAVESLWVLLGRLGITFEPPRLDLLLPVGISFYIFQAVGYTMDVYRGRMDAEKNVLRYALFVAFFPQLVAGPIERSTSLLMQMRNVDKLKLWDAGRVQRGVLLMLYGFFMKMVIADRVAILVNTVYDPMVYYEYKGFVVLTAAVLFSVQIYCDFAGYTNIAIGAAKIMGFDLLDNFNTPYFAVSIKDFWSRWHISLTAWFKDYLYVPLGGSRMGTLRKYINVFVVFLLSGLWHGAAWHYVVWGVIHGMMRIVGETTLKLRAYVYRRLNCKCDTPATRFAQMVFTFALVTGAWMFFRGESTHQTCMLLKNMLTVYNPWTLFDGTLFTLGLDAKEWNVMLVSIAVLLFVDFCKYRKIDLVALFLEQNLWFRGLIFYLGIVVVVVFGIYGSQYDATQFIYFQF